MQKYSFFINYCSFFRQQKLIDLALIDRLMHFEYTLTLILEKKAHVFSMPLTNCMKSSMYIFQSLKIGPILIFEKYLNSVK